MSDATEPGKPESEDRAWDYPHATIKQENNTVAPPYNPNRFDMLIDLAAAIDNFRIFPRVFISVYIYLFYESVMWFMDLEAPTVEQAGLISVVTGIGAAWFGLYVNSKKN